MHDWRFKVQNIRVYRSAPLALTPQL